MVVLFLAAVRLELWCCALVESLSIFLFILSVLLFLLFIYFLWKRQNPILRL